MATTRNFIENLKDLQNSLTTIEGLTNHELVAVDSDGNVTLQNALLIPGDIHTDSDTFSVTVNNPEGPITMTYDGQLSLNQISVTNGIKSIAVQPNQLGTWDSDYGITFWNTGKTIHFYDDGNITASSFTGDGSGLTDVNIVESQVTDLDKYTQSEVDTKDATVTGNALAFAIALG